MSTTMASGLVSDAEWVDLLRRFDTDLDARQKALAVDPSALETTIRIKRARSALLACPTVSTLQAAQKAVADAEAAVVAADRERTKALEIWRQTRERHDAAIGNRNKTSEAAQSLAKPFAEFAGHVGSIGRAGLGVLANELKERGITVKGDRVHMPV